jgi:hypothetical protein
MRFLSRQQLAQNPSALALAQVLDYLARVAVQDAFAMLCSKNAELRKAAAANKVIKFMLELPRSSEGCCCTGRCCSLQIHETNTADVWRVYW